MPTPSKRASLKTRPARSTLLKTRRRRRRRGRGEDLQRPVQHAGAVRAKNPRIDRPDLLPFTQLRLHPSLLRAIKELGFARPTPIQADAIPAALSGRDVLASSHTGSGKTAAFLLPILQALIGKPRGMTRALILAPTRELAAQILGDLE